LLAHRTLLPIQDTNSTNLFLDHVSGVRSGLTGLPALTNSLAFDSRGNLFGLIDNGSGQGYLVSIDTATASGSIITGPLSVEGLQAIVMATDPIGVEVEDRQSRNTPGKFALEQNYPNPFNPKTGIRFSIPTLVPGVNDVKLVVYDILGREVAVLVNERKSAGTYEASFDGGRLASGVYVYRLTAGSFVQSRKMLLMR
jgi:hypothetical protein